MQINFQAGVEAVYDAVVAKGITPASTSLSDVVQGIMDIPGATIHTATYTASTSSSALDMGENHNYRYVDTSALTKVSGTKSITANGNSQNVAAYQYVNVNVANTVSASRITTQSMIAVNTGYTFTRSAGYAYMVACHVDNSGTVWGSFIINSAGSIQENNGNGWFSLTKNSSTSFTVKKYSGSDPMWVSIYRAL
jgi:hypothetical protein